MPYDHASDPRNQAIGTRCTAASEDDDARLGPRSRKSHIINVNDCSPDRSSWDAVWTSDIVRYSTR